MPLSILAETGKPNRSDSSPSVVDSSGGPEIEVETQQLSAESLLAKLATAQGTEKDGARQRFFEDGYFTDAVQKLRCGDSPQERAQAALSLGIAGSELATADLVAALFDNEAEVRAAAIEGLKRIGDPSVNLDSINGLFGWEDPSSNVVIETGDEIDSDIGSSLLELDPDLHDLPRNLVADLLSLDAARRARALERVAFSDASEAARVIAKFLDDPSAEVRNAAALALNDREPYRSAEYFGQALQSASAAGRRIIADAIVGSGLAAQAINDLKCADRPLTYNALCVLSLLVKNNAVEPLIQVIEDEASVEVRSAAVKLLTLNGQTAIAREAVKRRLKI